MYSKDSNLLAINIAIDFVLLNLSMWLVYYFDLGAIQSNKYSLPFYMLQANLAWIIAYFFFAKHDLYLRDSFRHRIRHITTRIVWFTIVLIALTFICMKGDISRTYMFSYILIFLLLEIINYCVSFIYFRYLRIRGRNTKRILLIGYTEISNQFRKMIETTPMLGYKFIGYLNDSCDTDRIPTEDHPCILGNVSELEKIVKDYNIEVVFSGFSFFRMETNVDRCLAMCNQAGVRMYLVVENQQWFRENKYVESIGDFYILNPQRIPLDDPLSRIWKRCFDIIFSSVVLLIGIFTLFPLIAILIKSTSKGPLFFIQDRTGMNNKTFRCYKFRTMVTNPECNRQQATPNDPRITWIGHFMRRWNIDEFPQFFNVFRGNMSVVGPRPHMLQHTEQYSTLIKHYCIRHYVKPGITGWAQVNGLRGQTDELWKMENRVKYDMKYIEDWSFRWDLRIIWLTVFGSNAKENAG